MALPLLTPSDFSAATGGQVGADDPRLTPLIEGATAAIRRYCGWHVSPEAQETVVLDGPGTSLLVLPTLRVVVMSSIVELGATLTEDAFEWSADGRVRRHGRCWTGRYRAVEVTLTHGFTDAADVTQIVQQVVSNAISSPMGATREQAGQVSMQWSTTAPGVSGGISLLQRDLDVLSRYRLPKAA